MMAFPLPLRRAFLLGLTCALCLPVGARAQDLLGDYCLDCHNFEDWAGGLSLEGLDAAAPGSDPALWEAIVRKMRTGMMPPPGEPRPTRPAVADFAAGLEGRLDAAAGEAPASPALHRLNREEYGNAIADLLGLRVDTAMLLPLDDASEGFDNMAASLGNSPALMQGYVGAAMKISRLAVGDRDASATTAIYEVPGGLTQDRHLEGMPLGTRGGIRLEHFFPLDAEYRFRVSSGFGFRDGNYRIAITLDGETLQVEDPRDFTLALTGGRHEFCAAMVDLKRPAGVNGIYAASDTDGALSKVEISGPYRATGTGRTASREIIFDCYPEHADQERACARRIISRLAGRAFRRPLEAGQLQPLMEFFERGRRERDFETGIQQALARILMDPRFLFRLETPPPGAEPGRPYPLDGVSLASRLSFFLWSSIPDQELLALAASGELVNEEVLAAQARRMLADPRASALVDNFAGQWLQLRALDGLSPEHGDFDENLRRAFRRESELLIEYVFQNDRPVTELLDASYTFLNERLALHYGIDGVRGDWLRRVSLPAHSPRRGLLGHGSILTITSTATRTSPVIRGNWILETLLHAPVPAPPPGVETDLDAVDAAGEGASVRQRLERHRRDPACASCHGVIDPLGFALENFDSVGAWRERDGNTAVDARGVLVDGTRLGGPGDLRRALMDRREVFVTALIEKLLTYALGRGLDYRDMPEVRRILAAAREQDYRFESLVRGIITSRQFREGVVPPEAEED